MKPEMVRRAEATTATMNKYRNKPFNWKAGTTCIHLLRFHLRQLGYKPEPLPRIRSAIGARRALDKRGWQHVGDMLDSLLPRVAVLETLSLQLGEEVYGEPFGNLKLKVLENKSANVASESTGP